MSNRNKHDEDSGLRFLSKIAWRTCLGSLFFVGSVYVGLAIVQDERRKCLADPVYQNLPQELRQYDSQPRDGYLSASEMEQLVKDFELKKKESSR